MVAHLDRQLRRSNRDRILLGVAGGLGEYFGLDPILFRAGFILGALAGGIGLLAYLVLAVVLPVAGEQTLTEDCTDCLADTTGSLWVGGLAGLMLVSLGLVFMIGELGWLTRIPWGVVWSLLLIGVGTLVILRRR
jgi:phage shock protein C